MFIEIRDVNTKGSRSIRFISSNFPNSIPHLFTATLKVMTGSLAVKTDTFGYSFPYSFSMLNKRDHHLRAKQ